MGMTEKQGGSDVRANTTRAVPPADGTYRLTGHKWFTSAPMCDLFLVLAQAPGGLSCFLVPRVLPDGTRNTFRIQRLKDKLGNQSNASAEPEFDDAVAWLVGEEGRGVPTIIEMVNMTRLDCVIGGRDPACGVGRRQAAHHARHRQAFGRDLVDQPLMRNVLADLAVESEAATTLMLRLAGAADRAARGDEHEAAFRRLALAVGKYWVCKRGPAHAGRGAGVPRRQRLRRGFRHAPAVPRGAAELDLGGLGQRRRPRRAARARPPARSASRPSSPRSAWRPGPTRGWTRRSRLRPSWPTRPRPNCGPAASSSRWPRSCRARCWSGTATRAVADAFCASRLGGDWGLAFGTLPAGVDTAAIVERATPTVGL